jgi:DNA-binding transcriptional ArsR family regulator
VSTATEAAAPNGDADVASVASLIGDPTRAKVLMALLDGRSLAASVLAAEAGVSASTISEHLTRLVDAGLLTAHREGRSRFFRIAGPGVAEALEALARIAPPQPIRSLRQGTHAHALRTARTCYNHVAGKLGVALMAGLLEHDLLTGGDGLHHPEAAPQDHLSAPGKVIDYGLTGRGVRELTEFGLDLDSVMRHRPAIRNCLDWSEQRHHLAGPLGTALTDRLFELDWIRRGRRRAVVLTEAGKTGLEDVFGARVFGVRLDR